MYSEGSLVVSDSACVDFLGRCRRSAIMLINFSSSSSEIWFMVAMVAGSLV